MMIGGISNAYQTPYTSYVGAQTQNNNTQNPNTVQNLANAQNPNAVQNSGNAQNPNAVQNTTKNIGTSDDTKVKAGYKSSPAECQTCKERKYQDGSDENDVSFKAPGHISPEASASTVMAHERQHVSNAYQEAAQKDGKVISSTVSLHTAICPECGTVYVAGGTTRTSISYPNESNPYQRDKKAQDAIRFVGANIDYVA